MNIRPFRFMRMLLFWTVLTFLGSTQIYAALRCPDAHSGSHQTTSIFQELRTIEPIAEQEAYRARHRFSNESIEYLRQASGNPKLTDAQLLSLYKNNFLLLAFRANKVFIDMATENFFRAMPVEALQQLARQRWQDLSLPIDAKAVKLAIEGAIRETDRADFSQEEIVSIIQIFAINQRVGELYPLRTDEALAEIAVLRDVERNIMDELSPSLRGSLGVEKRSASRFCCQGGCSLCPLSVGLKREIKREGSSLDAHLKEVAGVEPPAELTLFQLMRKLKSLLPKVNW